MRINAALAQADLTKPKYAYGQLATILLKTAEKCGLLRAAFPADVPETAVVTKCDIVIGVRGSWSGSRVFSAQRNATPWTAGKVTWNNRPGVIGTVHSTTVGAKSVGDQIRIDVLSDAQAMISGSIPNRGWRITSDEAVSRKLYGATADTGKPWLDFEYVIPGEAPTELHPDGGAVSIAKPTLSFATADEILSLQVQIDAAADTVSPDFDSGEVPASGPSLDLASTAFGGLTDGGTTYWRVRIKTDLGWTAYSTWATLPRVSKPTVTITSPGATTGDKTPPCTWTAAGQVSWRATLEKPNGKILDDSSKTTSSDHDWTPDEGIKKVGDSGRFRVKVWDGVDRVATPGDPIHSEAVLDFTVVHNDVAPGVDALTATLDGPSPVVRLAWPGPAADFFQVVRDDEMLDRIDGLSTGYLDYTADPRAQHVYQVRPTTSTGLVSPNGPLATITPQPAGIWLIDPETDERIMLLDAVPEFSMAERAIVHELVGDRPPVRRRSGKPPPAGTWTGVLMDSTASDYPAAAMAATALVFKDNEQGRVYRLVDKGWNLPVTIGDMTVFPVVDTQRGVVSYSVSFSWWQTRHESRYGGA